MPNTEQVLNANTKTPAINKESDGQTGSEMTEGNKDVLRLIKQIEIEIREIREEREKVEETVTRQMEIFWDGLPTAQRKPAERDRFMEMYKGGLKAKILEALDRAESTLLFRKKQLAVFS